ncbi:MAG: hypothetical protein VX340_05035 [Pseudomonadota bacterium]|nr:hypothetical protein [Pseudomonadota bacterium]MEE3093447.1 hypothetical protein [Pseudomonadota bacterium]
MLFLALLTGTSGWQMPVLLGLGAQVAIGAFLFGLGMQLGNGWGSGTLFTLGAATRE